MVRQRLRIKQYNKKELQSVKIKLIEINGMLGQRSLDVRVEGGLFTIALIHKEEQGHCPTIIKLEEHQETC